MSSFQDSRIDNVRRMRGIVVTNLPVRSERELSGLAHSLVRAGVPESRALDGDLQETNGLVSARDLPALKRIGRTCAFAEAAADITLPRLAADVPTREIVAAIASVDGERAAGLEAPDEQPTGPSDDPLDLELADRIANGDVAPRSELARRDLDLLDRPDRNEARRHRVARRIWMALEALLAGAPIAAFMGLSISRLPVSLIENPVAAIAGLGTGFALAEAAVSFLARGTQHFDVGERGRGSLLIALGLLFSAGIAVLSTLGQGALGGEGTALMIGRGVAALGMLGLGVLHELRALAALERIGERERAEDQRLEGLEDDRKYYSALAERRALAEPSRPSTPVADDSRERAIAAYRELREELAQLAEDREAYLRWANRRLSRFAIAFERVARALKRAELLDEADTGLRGGPRTNGGAVAGALLLAAGLSTPGCSPVTEPTHAVLVVDESALDEGRAALGARLESVRAAAGSRIDVVVEAGNESRATVSVCVPQFDVNPDSAFGLLRDEVVSNIDTRTRFGAGCADADFAVVEHVTASRGSHVVEDARAPTLVVLWDLSREEHPDPEAASAVLAAWSERAAYTRGSARAERILVGDRRANHARLVPLRIADELEVAERVAEVLALEPHVLLPEHRHAGYGSAHLSALERAAELLDADRLGAIVVLVGDGRFVEPELDIGVTDSVPTADELAEALEALPQLAGSFVGGRLVICQRSHEGLSAIDAAALRQRWDEIAAHAGFATVTMADSCRDAFASEGR